MRYRYDDTEAPLSDLFRLTGEMTANKIGWELRLYSGTGHNFTADPQNDDERHANTLSQAATARFLKEVLGH